MPNLNSWACDLCGAVISGKVPCVLSPAIPGWFCSTVCMAVETSASVREELDAGLEREYHETSPAGRVQMRGKLHDVRDRRSTVVRTRLELQAHSRNRKQPKSRVCRERQCGGKAEQFSSRCARCNKKKHAVKIRHKRKRQLIRIRGMGD